jgi:hypothetical protein
MFNNISISNVSSRWLLGGWLGAIAVIVAISVGMDAQLSTSAFLLGIGMAPPIVFMFMRAGAPSPTVAEILNSATAKDGRS